MRSVEGGGVCSHSSRRARLYWALYTLLRTVVFIQSGTEAAERF